jgi:hypothetical protein
MPEVSAAEYLAELSAAGLLAVLVIVVLVFYRRDVVGHRTKVESREQRMLDVIERNASTSEKLSGGIDHLGRSIDQLSQRVSEDRQERQSLLASLVHRRSGDG